MDCCKEKDCCPCADRIECLQAQITQLTEKLESNERISSHLLETVNLQIRLNRLFQDFNNQQIIINDLLDK